MSNESAVRAGLIDQARAKHVNVGLSFSKHALSKCVGVCIAVLIAACTFYVLFYAEDDFSYDYIHYIRYFETLAEVGVQELFDGLRSEFPLPYIRVPPSGLFEVGFGALAWALLYLFEPGTAYALIASGSVLARLIILRALNVSWTWIALVNIYAITMFEANAIRLGCAFTLVLFGVLASVKNRSVWCVGGAFIFGALFHLQSIFFSLPFFIAFHLLRLVKLTRLKLLAALFSVSFCSVLLVEMLYFLRFSKLEDYAGRSSGAVGVNSVSVLGVIAMIVAVAQVFVGSRNGCREGGSASSFRTWVAVLFATLPALILLLLGGAMGAIGDRVWQFAFLVFSCVAVVKFESGHLGREARLVIVVLMLVSIINVVFRYPLSNFFSPIVPYTHFDTRFI